MATRLAIAALIGMIALGTQAQAQTAKTKADLVALIDRYSQARANKDTALLKTIITGDIDQLVSTGEWRVGDEAAVQGMLRSSETNPGARTLEVDKIRMLAPTVALVDCRYDLAVAGGAPRKMWSSFIVVSEQSVWKIGAIRNMRPAPN